jgi:hypothetical protein
MQGKPMTSMPKMGMKPGEMPVNMLNMSPVSRMPITSNPSSQPSAMAMMSYPVSLGQLHQSAAEALTTSSMANSFPSPAPMPSGAILDSLKKAASSPYKGYMPTQHNVYEMAALTQDLDTQLITTKIKETLLANNIGQKVSYYHISNLERVMGSFC